MSNITTRKQAVLNFFKDAFCADDAEFATKEEIADLKPEGVMKITTSDGRGIFYVARMIDFKEWLRLRQEVLLEQAVRDGWTDIHGGDTGAYWRGNNPETGIIEKLPEKYIV